MNWHAQVPAAVTTAMEPWPPKTRARVRGAYIYVFTKAQIYRTMHLLDGLGYTYRADHMEGRPPRHMRLTVTGRMGE